MLRTLLRRAAGVAFFVLLVVLLLEGGLRFAALFAGDRATDWRAGAEVRILAVGDSHTYGAQVEPEESYPAQLQQLLDEREPGHYSVINLGLPGMSTTQVRRRLLANVARYEPDIVIVWCGVNNYWNSSEIDAVDAGWTTRMEALGHRSRLYRMIRVWFHDRAIAHSASSSGPLRADGVRQETSLENWVRDGDGRGATHTLRLGGREETIQSYHDPDLEGQDLWGRTHEDYAAMADALDAAGIPLLLVRYPLGMWPFKHPNEAMERVARERGVPLVDSRSAVERVPKEERRWLWASHPSGPLYREIARDIVSFVVQLSPPASEER